MDKLFIGIGVGLILLVVIILVAFLTSFITLWAWNTFMPFIFHLPTINFWQAFAFNLLAGCFKATLTNIK